MKIGSSSLLVALLLGTSSIAMPTPARAQSASPPTTTATVPPIAYRHRALANGLRVYTIQDQSSPNVSVQVWYDVGSKDDPAGRSGFAHLFEHLMFKSTRNMVPEQFDRLTEDVGGFNNASTYDDFTNYYEVVPANHLRRLLWAEAERMGSLVVEPGFFASERDVVKEEFRSRVLASPYGKLFYLYMPQVSYSTHPYGRPGIGSIEDLDAATVDDVRAFHATYYRPDNAVLVVAGRFDQAELDSWIDAYFGPIARPAFAVPRVSVVEPMQSEPKSFTVREPNTPLPAAAMTFPTPPASSPDSAVVEVIDAILSAGNNSRLYQALVYRDQIASEADTFNYIKQGQGSLLIYAFLASGKTAAEGEAAIRKEIARLRDEAVTAAELQEAKNELLTQALRDRETVEGKAAAIAEGIILRGDAGAAERRLAAIASTTAADIRRVARLWLDDRRSAAIRYLPESDKTGEPSGTIATAATVKTAALVAPPNVRIVEPAPEAQRVAPPPPGPTVATQLPVPNLQKLANGLTIVTATRGELPLVTATLMSSVGAAADPDGKAGLARLTTQLLTKGTTSRSATEIAQAIEALGATVGTDAAYDGANVSVTVKADQLDAAMAILADVARNPTFASEELERQRGITADALTVALNDPAAVARQVANRAVFGKGSYGHPIEGTPDSLKAIGAADVRAHYARAFAPGRTTLILAGAIDPGTARTLAARHFGGWERRPVAIAERPVATATARGKTLIIDMPGAGQAAVAVVREAVERNDPRFYPALVANAVLGTGYSSRLNQEIRIKRGLSYGARSNLDARRRDGSFVAVTQTKNESAAEVLSLILAEMQRLGTELVPAAELSTRQAVLNGSFGRTLETTAGLAGLVAEYSAEGVSLTEVGRYQKAIDAITPVDAKAAASALLSPADATVVIVGDARQFADALRRDGREFTVLPLTALDLDEVPGR